MSKKNDNASDEDIERQRIVENSPQAGRYGAVENNEEIIGCLTDEKEKLGRNGLPLVFGFLDISPEELLKIFFWVYVSFFLFYRAVDIHYIATVDGEFPDGLGHLYPSELERQLIISYTRHTLECGLLAKLVGFGVVVALVLYKGFAKADEALHSCVASVGAWLSACCSCSCCGGVGGTISQCFNSLLTCCGACGPGGCCLTCCGACGPGGCCDSVVEFFSRIGTTCGIKRTWRELLFGALYITLFAALFFLLAMPFMIWRHTIDIEFGFTNTLSIQPGGLRNNMLQEFLTLFIIGLPGKFLFLLILQMRFGWLLFWVGMTLVTFFVQTNVAELAPMIMGMNTKFPASTFIAGHGFPLVPTDVSNMPWVSLNRLYFQTPGGQFVTKDKSPGPLVLTNQMGPWVIAPNLKGSVGQPMALTEQPARGVSSLGSQTWKLASGSADGAQMGPRDGKYLSDTIFGFAKKHHITVEGVYMVDGSHQDVRANAFVAGNVNGSVIGLYDTLFLGQPGGSNEPPRDEETKGYWETSFSIFNEAMEALSATEQDKSRPAHSAPTQAMDDDEILSILAHELGHAHHGHMERKMWFNFGTSFITFAALGWMAHSPVVAIAFSVATPLLHVAAVAYERVVSRPLEGVTDVATNWLIRKGEYEADAWVAWNDAKLGRALQTALAKLSISSNQDADVPILYEWLHLDHPCFSNRYYAIEAAMQEAHGQHTEER